MTRARPPLEVGDTYIALPGCPLTEWNSDAPPDAACFIEWLGASLRLVHRHACGALEFVVVEATGMPPRQHRRASAPVSLRIDPWADLEIPAFLDRRNKTAAAGARP